MIFINRYNKDISGVAAVEFALLAPMLIFILIGVVDIGTYINDKMKTESIARAAVEYMLVTQDDTNILTDVVQPYYAGIGDANWSTNFDIQANMVCECEDGSTLDCVTGVCTLTDDYKRRYYEVSVSKQHNTIFPYPGFPDLLMLSGDARMQLD